MAEQKRLRVGILGAGEVAQVIHLPTLTLLSSLFTLTSICDISAQTASHCATKFHIPHHTTSASELLTHPSVDVVFVLTSDEYHAPYTTAALRAGKHVFVEKPLTLSLPSAHSILAAEAAAPNGARVFVGYMRRYAPSFVSVFRAEVQSIPRILYARVRDIIGPNAYFVGQSGTEPVRLTDFPAGADAERKDRVEALVQEAWEGREVTPERMGYTRFLGGLGSHDLSLMREALGGLPERVDAVAVHPPFYNALMTYRNRGGGGEAFAVVYESGVDEVPRFDAHVAVYGERKSVEIRYDTPYVKGLPIVVVVEEKGEGGEKVRREVMSSYEDAYTAEMRELWACLVEGRACKTTVGDALEDLSLFDMMYKAYDGQMVGK
ncbi:hypothetical protein MMC26_006679 [Xylographa opegraphella]|nr:hypothetical protein [Xylographa opegraphella]